MTGQKENKDEIKESFCPICIAAIPLAFGVTTGVGAAYEDEEYLAEKKRKIIMWSIILTVISLLVMGYFFFFSCDSCA